MRDPARFSAAIDILDKIMVHGVAAEKALTGWARNSRFAGSKDRAFVRDVVFSCSRQWNSLQSLGFEGPRGCVAGYVLQQSMNIDDMFSGEGYGPETLTSDERDLIEKNSTAHSEAPIDLQDWVHDLLLKDDVLDIRGELSLMGERANLDLRVNIGKSSVQMAKEALAMDSIETDILTMSPNALRVTSNPRRVSGSGAYVTGLVELQDVGSQAIVEALPLEGVTSVLDYCAGGGGKTLAYAARCDRSVLLAAYDKNQSRMTDLDARAERAGVNVSKLEDDPVLSQQTYDLVIADVPCSGSGSWRRNPDGKWKLTQESLEELLKTQAHILSSLTGTVSKDGHLAFITCSLFKCENENQVAYFLEQHPEWESRKEMRLSLKDGGDGFYLNILSRR
jgi:16S rRNA (cytosine967-C5)-methyltransferase